MTEKIIIPKNKLKQAYEKLVIHIDKKIQTCETLLGNNKFENVCGESVLILEETAKLHLIRERINSKKPIYENDWKAMTKHKKKLTIPFKKLSAKVNRSGGKKAERAIQKLAGKFVSEQVMETVKFVHQHEKTVLETLSAFDQLKQDSFYLNIRNGKLFSISSGLTKKEQKLLAKWSLNYAKIHYFGARAYLDKKYVKKYAKIFTKTYDEKGIKEDYKGFKIFGKLYFPDDFE